MRTRSIRLAALNGFLSLLVSAQVRAQTATPSANEPKKAMLARAKAAELPTAYVPPPGDALSHHTSGFAKIMCSAVFITGLDPDFAAENVGYFTAPYAERKKVSKPVIDRTAKTVSITLPNGVVRTAVYTGGQGCITYPEGKKELFFKPVSAPSSLPDPAKQPWPMGDVLDASPLPKEIDQAKLKAAVDAAFDPTGLTAAFVVTYKGRLVAERYGEGITPTTPLESWSMGKSLTGTLIARLIQQGAYKLWDPAPIPEWQKTPGDPRAGIRIGDIMRMSSGLRIRAPQDPDFDPAPGYPDHLYLYTGGANSYQYAATRPPQWPPNTIGRYRNTDPVLGGYLVRLAVEKRGEDYLSFPRRALLDKIGMRTMVMETDPYGNFLTQGYELASARDWARLGNLYLQDGVWNGERLLPEGYVTYARTVAPAWEADGRPVYGGGFFWVNGDGAYALPKSAFSMQGAGGQSVMIVPSHDLVIVRLGHFKGAGPGGRALNRAYALLAQAVPSHP
jgi:CubicO group peptidase (beta-lactamase class C family)